MTWGFGKVILLGEHAVVYDHPAVAGALSLGVRCSVEARGKPTTRLAVAAWDVDVSTEDDNQVARALRALTDQLGTGVWMSADVTVPPAAGLGSSAALAVAVTRCLAQEFDRAVTDADVARIANEAERCFHGTPSGIDVALASTGGLGVFRRSTGLRPIAAAPVSIAIGLSGQPKRTGDMVGRVATQVAENPTATNETLAELGALADAGVDALESADQAALGELMNRAHAGLSTLDLSTDVLDRMVDVAKASGALGAKLTGGGGGGAVIALAPGNEQSIIDAWRDCGWQGFHCAVGVTE